MSKEKAPKAQYRILTGEEYLGLEVRGKSVAKVLGAAAGLMKQLSKDSGAAFHSLTIDSSECLDEGGYYYGHLIVGL